MSATHHASGTVRPLHRIKVLLATRDPVFLNTATLFCRRRGFRIDTVRHATDVAARVAEREPDVVVLDATGRIGWTARIMARVHAEAPRVAFILVAAGLDKDTRDRLGILDRASSLECLGTAVERAYFRWES